MLKTQLRFELIDRHFTPSAATPSGVATMRTVASPWHGPRSRRHMVSGTHSFRCRSPETRPQPRREPLGHAAMGRCRNWAPLALTRPELEPRVARLFCEGISTSLRSTRSLIGGTHTLAAHDVRSPSGQCLRELRLRAAAQPGTRRVSGRRRAALAVATARPCGARRRDYR